MLHIIIYHKHSKVSQMVAFTRNDAILSNYSSTSICDPSSLSEVPSGTHFCTLYYNLEKKTKQNNNYTILNFTSNHNLYKLFLIPDGAYSDMSMTLCERSWGLQLPDSQSFQNFTYTSVWDLQSKYNCNILAKVLESNSRTYRGRKDL